MAIEREPTGIPGFDELIEGGFPRYSIVLVSGSPGTGKSLFSQHFVYTGATKFEQKALYVSFEQRIPEIYEQAKRFGMDFDLLEKQGKVRFVFYDISNRVLGEGETYVELIKREAREFNAKRIVIDSLVPLANFPVSVDELASYGFINEIDKLMPIGISEELLVRMQVHKLMSTLKDLRATSIVVSEIPKESNWLSRDRVSEFMADGVIVLHYLGIGTTSNRSLVIEKMRGTKHAEDVIPMEIGKNGIEIKKIGINL